jgi:tetratricopeptide (TPR) repeat protein/O-antigen ligase
MQARSKNRPKNMGTAALSVRIDQAIFWLTISALVIAPLAFSYYDVVSVFNELKVVGVHLTAGLIAVLWLWQIVLNRVNQRSAADNEFKWDLIGWAGRSPARWALIGAAIWVFAQVASTLLSPLPVISFYGGDEARSGYNLYDSLSLSIIFLSVALRFRTLRHLELLAYTLVITGTIAALYALAQHFGWDDIGGNAGRTRPIASFGNTLNFAGYMVMSIPATLALAYKKFNREWSPVVIITGVLSLQVTGIWIGGGRGSYVAIIISLITFFAISLAIGNTKQNIRYVGVLIVSALITAIVVALPSARGDIGLSRVRSLGSAFEVGSASTNIEAGLAGRVNIWTSTLRLTSGWDLPIDEPVENTALRPLFGIGQDMYVYAFPLVADPQSQLALVDHAHNYELMVLVEQGFVGLFGFMMLTVLLGVATFAITRRFRRAGRGLDATGILLLVILPATIGKLADLQTGVARISDLAMMLAFFGATIAIYEIANRQLRADEPEMAPEKTKSGSATALTASNQTVLGSVLLAAVVSTVIFATLFVSWDLRRLSASRTLAVGWDAETKLERAQVWDEIQKKAPERESFTFSLFEQYLIVAKQQHDGGNPEEGLRLLMIGRDMLLEYEKRDPFELDTQIGLSKITSTLAGWGHNEYAQELADRARRTADSYPAYPTLIGTSATALTSVGLHELAIEYADKAIAMEATTQPWSKAWYAKGRALYELGREEEAIQTLITATEKQPGAEGALLAHQVLAQIYEARGQDELFELHKELGGGEVTYLE